MFCPNCGEMVKDGVAFCPTCGTVIAKAAAPVVNDQPDAWKPTAPQLDTPIPEMAPVEEPAAPQLKPAGISLEKPAAAPAPVAPVVPVAPVQPAYNADAEALGSSALTFGILSLCFAWFPILSIVGLVFGIVAKKKANTVRAMQGDITGKCKVGHILGCLGLGFSIGMTVFWTIYIVIMIVALSINSYSYSYYRW